MKRILLADNHSIVRSGVKFLLEEICPQAWIDEAGNEPDITGYLKTNHYDLIVLDIAIPGLDFASLLRFVHSIPDTRLLILSTYPEEIYGARCLQMGAMGYLQKTAPNDEIISAIRKVLDGKKYISALLADLLVDVSAKHKSGNPFTSLSSREFEIVKYLSDGKSLPGICDILRIQYSTGNTYKRRIFEKLNVHTVHSLSLMMKSFNM